jgi:hypothetical protein
VKPLKLSAVHYKDGSLSEQWVIFGPGVAYGPDPINPDYTTVTIVGGVMKVKESVEFINERLHNANQGVN